MARANLLYEGTFEGSNPFLNVNIQPPNRISQSTDHSRFGNYSARIECNKTDPDIGASKRSEINRASSGEPTGAFERWYGGSWFLPTSWVNDTAPEIIVQWHEYTGTASPHFAIWSKSSHFWLAVDGIPTIDLGAYTLNAWTDFVFHMKWDSTSAGTFEMWKNGVKVTLPSNISAGANMPNQAHGPYLKCGIYKWYWKHYPDQSQTTQRIIYIDELRIGSALATYNDVAPSQILSNQNPVVNAGVDLTITSPASSVTLVGSATDDGTIASYAWTKVSGTGGAITSASSASTTVTGLSVGSYVFRLTVTDNNGATGTDTINVTVLAAPNIAPIVNAGLNKAITLPTSSVSFSDSTAIDNDGTIASYLWTKVSGPNTPTITTPTTLHTTVTGLIEGSYTFKLTVTDNSGATASSIITVIVYAAPDLNQLPTVNLAKDKTVFLPKTSVSLTGSASDADGTIATYHWTRLSGPNTPTIVSPNSATTSITGLIQGIYYFGCTFTDNDGGTAIDKIRVTVYPATQKF